MVDYEKIGRRIAEERKFIHKISQERMAEELGMYQADISNLEKAKKGSGITDLAKLDLIAEYFGIPLETLLFGKEGRNMVKYEGARMQLRQSRKKLTMAQKTVMDKVTGADVDKLPVIKYECGPYLILTLIEEQMELGKHTEFDEKGRVRNPGFVLRKPHTYIFLGGELIAAMVADITTVMQHVYVPALQKLQTLIQFDVLDVTDVWRTLNPYWALWTFSEEGSAEEQEYREKMVRRMDEIRASGQDRIVLYVESIYVREDCRRNGICRMYIDLLKILSGGDPVIWLNMEPTAGAELDREYTQYPAYTAAEVGQLNLNASIAEHLGFTVDPDTWHRDCEVTDGDGNVRVETILVRKCAYYLPDAVREVIKDDGDLVALGRAKQKIRHAEEGTGSEDTLDIRTGTRDGYRICEWKTNENGKVTYVYAAVSSSEAETYRFGTSRRSPIDLGIDHEGQMETFAYLDDAPETENLELYMTLLEMLGVRISVDTEEEEET